MNSHLDTTKWKRLAKIVHSKVVDIAHSRPDSGGNGLRSLCVKWEHARPETILAAIHLFRLDKDKIHWIWQTIRRASWSSLAFIITITGPKTYNSSKMNQYSPPTNFLLSDEHFSRNVNKKSGQIKCLRGILVIHLSSCKQSSSFCNGIIDECLNPSDLSYRNKKALRMFEEITWRGPIVIAPQSNSPSIGGPWERAFTFTFMTSTSRS